MMEAKRDGCDLEQEVLLALSVDDGITSLEIVEQFSYKYRHYLIYDALRRLVVAGKVRKFGSRHFGWLYARIE